MADWWQGATIALARGGILRTGYRGQDGWRTVRLAVGVAFGVGLRPISATAQSGTATVAATARVLPALGQLPPGVAGALRAGAASIGPWPGRGAGQADRALPSFPPATLTQQVVGKRRVVELAATGV